MLGLVVDQRGVLLEDVVAARSRGVLQLVDGLGVEQVHLALAAPLVLATEFELTVGPLAGPLGVRGEVTGGHLGSHLVEADATDAADRAGEVLVDEVVPEADRLEDLRTRVTGHGADAHLAHHLQHTLAGGLDVLLHGLLRVHPAEAVQVVADHVFDALEGEVRVDGAGPVAHEQCHVVHLAGITALDDQAHLRALLLADEVVVHGRSDQQRRDGRFHLVAVAVAQHDHASTLVDGLAHLGPHRVERALHGQATAGHAVQPAHHDGAQLGEGAVVVDVDDLGEVVVVDHRERQRQLAAALGPWCEQVGLWADRRTDRGDHLFTNGVERRVGDLCEQLLEVVEQQPRSLAEHGDGRVGAHRTDRLGSTLGHRGDDELQLFVRVAEHLLATQHAVVAEHDVLAVGQFVQFGHALVEPRPIRLGRCELPLDLLVVDDATLGRVDEEHAARLQAALAHHLALVDVDDAHLARHHHQVVVGDPVAAGPQPVAVEHGPDDGAVGERHAGRAVPRLHQRCVEAVERPLVGVHRVVVLPRLGDHHQHRVRQAAPAEVQQFEHLVEAHRVAAARGADGEGPLETGQQAAGQQRLAGAHPVAVALHGVDLAVVGDEAVRVRQRPTGERVGAEAAVHQRERALHPFVGQVGVERRQLRRGEHALVDDGAAAERREVGALLGRQFVLDPLAGDEQLAVEVDALGPGRVGDEQLLEAGHHGHGAASEAGGIHRDAAPTEDGEALVGGDGLDRGLGLLGVTSVAGQEADTHRVGTRCRQFEAGHRAQEPIGHLDEDARTVAGVGLGTRGAAVLHVAQGTDAELHDVVAAHTLHVGDERHPARVVLETGVVQALGRGQIRVGMLGHRRRLHGVGRPEVGGRYWNRDDVGPNDGHVTPVCARAASRFDHPDWWRRYQARRRPPTNRAKMAPCRAFLHPFPVQPAPLVRPASSGNRGSRHPVSSIPRAPRSWCSASCRSWCAAFSARSPGTWATRHCARWTPTQASSTATAATSRRDASAA